MGEGAGASEGQDSVPGGGIWGRGGCSPVVRVPPLLPPSRFLIVSLLYFLSSNPELLPLCSRTEFVESGPVAPCWGPLACGEGCALAAAQGLGAADFSFPPPRPGQPASRPGRRGPAGPRLECTRDPLTLHARPALDHPRASPGLEQQRVRRWGPRGARPSNARSPGRLCLQPPLRPELPYRRAWPLRGSG